MLLIGLVLGFLTPPELACLVCISLMNCREEHLPKEMCRDAA